MQLRWLISKRDWVFITEGIKQKDEITNGKVMYVMLCQ